MYNNFFFSSSYTIITEYPCYDCDLERRKQGFPSVVSLKEHITYKHEPPKGHGLRAMHKRHNTKIIKPTIPSLLPPLRTIIGIENSSGLVSSK